MIDKVECSRISFGKSTRFHLPCTHKEHIFNKSKYGSLCYPPPELIKKMSDSTSASELDTALAKQCSKCNFIGNTKADFENHQRLVHQQEVTITDQSQTGNLKHAFIIHGR